MLARIIELGSEGATVEEIDAGLSLEGYTTSTGTPWPAKNDGRVVVRALLRGGLRPESRDHRIMTYAAQRGGLSQGAGGRAGLRAKAGPRESGRAYRAPGVRTRA